MSDDKKMNELIDDQLEQAAGGMVLKEGKNWIATSDKPFKGTRPLNQREGRIFSTEEEAVAYAKRRGWSTDKL